MLRIGLLGAARVAPSGIVAPAREVADTALVAVAARNAERARRFAAKHGIPRVHDSYEALLADPEIDAVYIALPNGLHGEWAIKAVRAGKHVLCEKPIAANAADAETMARAGRDHNRLIMEAFHYRYHPLAQRMADIVASGELGEVRHIRSAICFPVPPFSDVRYRFDLAGGAMMDAGCYAVHMARLVGGTELEVVSAAAKLRGADIDRAMTAELRFKSGVTCHLIASIWSSKLIDVSLRVTGTKGEMRVRNPLLPQLGHHLKVKIGAERRTENLGRRSSFSYQLEAFAGACLRGEPILTPVEDGVVNMGIIDAIYRAANLPPRQPTSPRPAG